MIGAGSMWGCAIFQRIGIVRANVSPMGYAVCVNQFDSDIPGKGPSIFAFSEQESRESILRDAIARAEIDVLFQPQIAASTGKVVGAEALARWRHDALGDLGAHELFTLARGAGLVPALSRQIAKKALNLAQDWPEALRLSINVTPAELNDRQFEAQFARMLGDCDFPIERLTIEITEDEPLQDLAGTAELLGRLSRGGISIALDDFGAGYCNFNYLKQLPLNTIKLDRSIIHGIEENRRDLAILRSIIELARALKLGVVAEGIETEAQGRIATEEGCTILQGFLIAEPVEANALLQFVEA